MSENHIVLSAEVPLELAGMRFDATAAKLFPDYSRARLQTWIKTGELTLDGGKAKTRVLVDFGALLSIDAWLEEQGEAKPEPMELTIVYEDTHILVIDKPLGLVVHPGAGVGSGTLMNGLLAHHEDAVFLPRAGIVHRLDKDTTGLMVVAKTVAAHTALVNAIKAREVKREYQAIVAGEPVGGGKVEAAIGRHPSHRTKMAVRERDGKDAITHYQIVQKFSCFTHLRLQLESGRTHQIRVHMAHIRLPLLGDPLYSNRPKMPKEIEDAERDQLLSLGRQALHASSLGLYHPNTGEYMEWHSELPDDFKACLSLLRGYPL